MLLRQLYLAHFEARRFDQAHEVAVQIIGLAVLTDVAHQDAARACQAQGDFEAATGHLRLAARVSPASRRAFHLWTLGGLFYLQKRYVDAVGALSRAARWGTTDKPLFVGHLALARCALGEREKLPLGSIIEQLGAAPCGQGYGRFVLGALCFHAGRNEEAVRNLEAFIKRTTSGRVALRIALEGEVEEARHLLTKVRSH
jgi:tetratricopeptide (TPR) repeat protein